MRSRGGVTGGLTITEALHLYEERGYTGQFGAREGGAIKCFGCGALNEPSSVPMDSMRRIEGVSDPDDMSMVAAVQCPSCGARGTLTVMYGPMAPPEDNEALRRLTDAREALRTSGTWDRDGWAPHEDKRGQRPPDFAL